MVFVNIQVVDVVIVFVQPQLVLAVMENAWPAYQGTTQIQMEFVNQETVVLTAQLLQVLAIL